MAAALGELLMLAAGQLYYRLGFRERDLRDVTDLIVQITTAGSPAARSHTSARLATSGRRRMREVHVSARMPKSVCA
jgi:hypothetical protein